MPEKLVLWNPLKAENIADPYNMYELLRHNDPVHQSQTGECILTRYEDVRRVLSDKTFLAGNRLNWFQRVADYANLKGSPFNNIPGALESFLLFKNPPDHTVWREGLTNIWPDEQLFSTVIEEYIDRLLGSETRELDFVTSFARPLASKVIGRVLGIKDEEAQGLIPYGFHLAKVMDLYIGATDVMDIDDSAGQLSHFFRQKFNNKGSIDTNGLLYKLQTIDNPEFRLDQNESLVSLAIFLYVAGLETTSSLVTLNLLNLIRNPERLIELKNNPHLIPFAVEELTRYDSPVQLLGRLASHETTIGDKKILRGDTLTLGIGASNRDPEKFRNPNTIDFHRKTIAHLSFGAGVHYCLGDRLAKMESRLTLQYILSKFRRFRILEEPDWENHLSIRRLKTLRIKIEP